MTQLSAHFRLDEFLYSETAARMGIELKPSQVEIDNLRRLCEVLLEPIRVKLGQPMVITSGYRPLWLNDVIGGSKTSAHLEGRAADVKVVGMSPQAFSRWLKNQSFPVDQVIEEFTQWTHIGLPKGSDKPRQEYLIASQKDGKTVYEVMV